MVTSHVFPASSSLSVIRIPLPLHLDISSSESNLSLPGSSEFRYSKSHPFGVTVAFVFAPPFVSSSWHSLYSGERSLVDENPLVGATPLNFSFAHETAASSVSMKVPPPTPSALHPLSVSKPTSASLPFSRIFTFCLYASSLSIPSPASTNAPPAELAKRVFVPSLPFSVYFLSSCTPPDCLARSVAVVNSS